MTRDEAVAQVRTLSGGTLTEDDIRGLVGCSERQLTMTITNYVDQHEALRTRTAWEKIVQVIAQVEGWAPTAKLIAKVVTGILAIV